MSNLVDSFLIQSFLRGNQLDALIYAFPCLTEPFRSIGRCKVKFSRSSLIKVDALSELELFGCRKIGGVISIASFFV